MGVKELVLIFTAVAVLVIGCVIILPKMADPGTANAATGDVRLWQARKVARTLWHKNAHLEYKLNLHTCEPQPDCQGGIKLAWQMLGDQWPGWPEKP